MAEYCPECKAEVKRGAKFCLSCGAKLEGKSSKIGEPASTEPIPEQHVQPQADIIGQLLGKSKAKIIGAVLLIVVVVVAAVLSGVLQDDASKFIGAWEDIRYGGTVTFYEDGTAHFSSESGGFFGTGYSVTYNWKIVDSKLVLLTGYASTSLVYEFSDFDRKIRVISLDDYKTTTLVKI